MHWTLIRCVGEILQTLRQAGHWDDTRIVFTGDHGDGNAHHHWNQKQVLYDEAARVPFVVTQPGSGLNRNVKPLHWRPAWTPMPSVRR